MSTHQLRQRLARIEHQIGPEQIAPDQRDPRLVQLVQDLKGDDFRIEMVPLGLSVKEVWTRVTASDKSRIRPMLNGNLNAQNGCVGA